MDRNPEAGHDNKININSFKAIGYTAWLNETEWHIYSSAN